MTRRFLCVAALVLQPVLAFAQQRPLVTEDPETVPAGNILFEAGVDFLQDVYYPASGLGGRLWRVGTFGFSFGVRSLADDTAGGSVSVLERSPERWLLTTEAPAERLLVFTQAFFPGWQATIDGAAAPLVRTNYMFQGLYVPAGAHQVEIVYRPQSLLVGAALSLAALLAAVILFALGRPRWPFQRRTPAAPRAVER